MKMLNYDPSLSAKSNYKQGHASMPANTFRMLICGPSGSGKTNTLLNMLYRLLVYDKIYLYTKNLHQDKYQYMLDDFEERVNPVAGYNVIEAGNDVIPLEMLPTDNQKIVIFDDLVCESSQRDDIINYFMTGRPRNCSAIYLSQSYFKTPKNIRDNCTTSVFSTFTPKKITVLLMNWGLTESCLKGLPTGNTLFYITTGQKNGHSRILMKIYRRMGYINGATGGATQTHEASGSIRGETGPAGPAGPTGATGPAGPKGEKGDKGTCWTTRFARTAKGDARVNKVIQVKKVKEVSSRTDKVLQGPAR